MDLALGGLFIKVRSLTEGIDSVGFFPTTRQSIGAILEA
jgi:hypothetical protein